MRVRVLLGHFMIRFGRFIKSLAIMVMRPDDLMAFSRQNYSKRESVDNWDRDEWISEGLYPDETVLSEKILSKKGRLLLLGMGTGREAIPLARMGFEVTGVDFVPEMVERAKENAARQGLKIKVLVQEISRLEVLPESYDVAWLSSVMYSSVPTRKRRVEMLRRIRDALRPQGLAVCQFHWGRQGLFTHKVERARKAVALLSLGNLTYETGDMLWGNVEFIHAFSSWRDLDWEFEEGGFEVLHRQVSEGLMRGGAVLKRKGMDHTQDPATSRSRVI